jgi:hypothetical protein
LRKVMAKMSCSFGHLRESDARMIVRGHVDDPATQGSA